MSIYVGRESSMSTLAPDLINANPEEMSNEKLVENIELLEASNQYLAIENNVIEMFLKQMEPELLAGMDHTMETPSGKSHSMIVPSPGTSRPGSELSTSVISHIPATLEKAPRINLSNKEDIVSRQIDELKEALDKLYVTSARQRANLKAKLEETKLSLQEINEAHTDLESVEKAVDPITGRIPAEKFVRHLEEWLKKADSMVEKLRLRTSTLRSMYIRLQQLLEQKEELGENLHPVDFEQLQIFNKQLLEKIEQKNRHLLGMKRMAGRCNRQLTLQKKKMQEQMTELHELQEELATLEAQGKEFEKAADIVEAEATEAVEKVQAVKIRMETYTAPDVLDYIKKTAEVYELQQAVKVWSRRKKVQQIALTACKRVLRNVQQSKRAQLQKKVLLEHLVGDEEGSVSEESFKTSSNILL